MAITARTRHDGIALIGAGLSSQRCAEMLRREGYDGPIRIIGEEEHPPYDRPPLSKALLQGTTESAQLRYRPEEWYRDHGVELVLGTRAGELWPAEHVVCLSDGSTLHYEKLLIATGARPRTLPLLDGLENVSVLRTLDDALSLRAVLARRPSLTIVGGGFIGLEVAATARGLGARVSLIEADRAPLNSVLGPVLADWFTRLHESEGVHVHAGVTATEIRRAGREVRSLILSDGSEIETDHVLVGVGVAPAVGWLADSGLGTPVGVLVSADGSTHVPGVFAAGDAAATWHADVGRHLPGSHWEAAARQAGRAAQRMLGRSPRVSASPSFWSDQYGLRVQYVGHRGGIRTPRIEAGGDARSFVAWFGGPERPVAAVLVNRPRELPAARAAIERRTHELSGANR